MQPEYINIVAIIMGMLSILTGFLAIGQKGLWNFSDGFSPYLKGNAKAYLYAVLIFTIIAGILHTLLLIDWLLIDIAAKSPLGLIRRYSWMSWHTFIELALCLFHVWAWRHRIERTGKPDIYFWGPDAKSP